MTTRTFGTLDGIRGVAALCIVCLHAHRYFEDLLPAAQMAVDLFFVLSGFVLAHAYEPRFRDGMTPLRFVCRRYARLYPIYLLGTFLGILQTLLFLHYQQGTMAWTWSKLLMNLPFALVMVPTPFDSTLFPLNGVMWSIFFELIANLIWAIFWRRLESTKVLVGVIFVSGALLTAAVFWYDSAALGDDWSTFIGGLFRVTYSFMFGILLHRFHGSVRAPRLPPLLLLAVLPVLAAFQLSAAAQLLCAVVVFPLLVMLGARVEPHGLVGLFCQQIGISSYAVYALHKRLYLLTYAALLQLFGLSAEIYAPWIGIAFLVPLTIGCIILTEVFETPARRKLTQLLDRRPASRATSA